MTSNQFLTMNRSCDMKVSHDKALAQRVADETAIAAGKGKGYLSAFAESDVPKMVAPNHDYTGFYVKTPDSETGAIPI